MCNEFQTIDAQDSVSRMSQLTTEEQAEYNAWLDHKRDEQDKHYFDDGTGQLFEEAMTIED